MIMVPPFKMAIRPILLSFLRANTGGFDSDRHVFQGATQRAQGFEACILNKFFFTKFLLIWWTERWVLAGSYRYFATRECENAQVRINPG